MTNEWREFLMKPTIKFKQSFPTWYRGLSKFMYDLECDKIEEIFGIYNNNLVNKRD